MKLRSYQTECVSAIWKYFESGKTGNQLNGLPTGTGKSLIIADFIKGAHKKFPNTRSMMITHVKEIIIQNRDTLIKIWPNAPLGIYSASLKRKDIGYPITYAGIQTVCKTPEAFPHIDLIIIDEAHLVPPKLTSSYGKFLNMMTKWNPACKVIGFTATPYRLGQGMLTDPGGIFTDMNFDITDKDSFNRLIDEGYLCNLVVKKPNKELDVSDVDIQGGDFILSHLQQVVDQDYITKQAIKELISQGEYRKHWLIFGTGIKHCCNICTALQLEGIKAAVVHSKMTDGQRDSTIADFKNGKYRALVNNNILCLDEQTEILTQTGWVNIDSMTYQHKVANWDNGRIYFKEPSFIVKRKRRKNEKMIILETTKRSIRITSNHKMLFKSHESVKQFKLISAINLVDKKGVLPICGKSKPLFIKPDQIKKPTPSEWNRQISANSYNLRKNGMNYVSARKETIKRLNQKYNLIYIKPSELSLNECAFIGFWLGDGSVSVYQNNGERYSASQSLVYPNIIKWFDKILHKANIYYTKDYPKSTNSVRWSFPKGTGFGKQKIKNGLYPLLPYLDKNGSQLWKSFNQRQFDAFLNGLFMADGNHGKGNVLLDSKLISNCNYNLLSLIQEIAVCKGFLATIHNGTYRPNKNHNQIYHLRLRKEKYHRVTKKYSFQIENKPYKDERVWCVTSETGNIITRRNGSCTVMGNTTGFDMPGIDLIGCLRPTISPGLWVQMLGRGTRPKENGSDCLVLDFAGNTRRLGPINDPITPKTKGKAKRKGDAPVKVCEVCNTYNHVSVTHCTQCGEEFPKHTKLEQHASSKEVISREKKEKAIKEPVVFKVDVVTYTKHSKSGSPDSVKVNYHCGYRSFNEWVCFEHTGFPYHKAKEWWNKRSSEAFPETTNNALHHIEHLDMPTHIKVDFNKKYPDIVGIDFSNTAFKTIQPANIPGQILG